MGGKGSGRRLHQYQAQIPWKHSNTNLNLNYGTTRKPEEVLTRTVAFNNFTLYITSLRFPKSSLIDHQRFLKSRRFLLRVQVGRSELPFKQVSNFEIALLLLFQYRYCHTRILFLLRRSPRKHLIQWSIASDDLRYSRHLLLKESELQLNLTLPATAIEILRNYGVVICRWDKWRSVRQAAGARGAAAWQYIERIP